MLYVTFNRRFIKGLLVGIVNVDTMATFSLQTANEWMEAVNEKSHLDYKLSNLALAYNPDDEANSPIKFSLNPLDDVGGFDLRVEYPPCYQARTIESLARRYVGDFMKDYVLRKEVSFCPATSDNPTEVLFYELAKIA